MGWGSIRREKWNDTGGICEFCGHPIDKISQSCLHHKINQSQGGKYTYENAELRHKTCEKQAHEKYPFGNREGNLKGGRDVYGKRRPRHRVKGKGKRHYLPKLQGEGVNATFREVPKNRPVHKLPETIQDSNSRTIEERLERIERVLFPCT